MPTHSCTESTGPAPWRWPSALAPGTGVPPDWPPRVPGRSLPPDRELAGCQPIPARNQLGQRLGGGLPRSLLAQAFLLTRRREYLDEAFRQIESWLDANPFLHGINWASALEVAFRALSWHRRSS